MKKTIWVATIAILALFTIGFAASDDSSTSKRQKTNVEQESEADSQAREEPEEAGSQQRKQNSFLGTYEITDKVGCTIHLTLNEDGTATITGVKGEGVTYYCTWEDYRDIDYGIKIIFSDEKPYLVYDNGVGDSYHVTLKDGWLYAENTKAIAKNPQWRLKATKIR